MAANDLNLSAQEVALNHDQRRAFKRIKWGSVENECRRRRLPLRVLWTVQALKVLYKAHHHDRIYAGDVLLARKVPVNRGRLKDPRAGCSVSSIYRAKRQLEQLCILNVIRSKGGTTLNDRGEKVAAATGYEFHPALYFDLAEQLRDRRALEKQQRDQDDKNLTPQQRNAAKARELAASFQRAQAAQVARAGP